MNPPTGFQKMRANREAMHLRKRMAESERVLREMEQRRKESDARRAAFDREQQEREDDLAIKRMIYDAGMAMWGCDLQTCFLGPVPAKVPMPPVMDGKPYKMMDYPPKEKA